MDRVAVHARLQHDVGDRVIEQDHRRVVDEQALGLRDTSRFRAARVGERAGVRRAGGRTPGSRRRCGCWRPSGSNGRARRGSCSGRGSRPTSRGRRAGRVFGWRIASRNELQATCLISIVTPTAGEVVLDLLTDLQVHVVALSPELGREPAPLPGLARAAFAPARGRRGSRRCRSCSRACPAGRCSWPGRARPFSSAIDVVLVDGVVQRLAHAAVVERGDLAIEADVARPERHALHELAGTVGIAQHRRENRRAGCRRRRARRSGTAARRARR